MSKIKHMAGDASCDGRVPVTQALLCFIDLLHGFRKAYSSQDDLARCFALPESVGWFTRCQELFFKTYSQEVEMIGLSRNQATFEAIMRIEISEEVASTEYSLLPKRFVFDPSAEMGCGGIVRAEGWGQDELASLYKKAEAENNLLKNEKNYQDIGLIKFDRR